MLTEQHHASNCNVYRLQSAYVNTHMTTKKPQSGLREEGRGTTEIEWAILYNDGLCFAKVDC